MNWRWTWARRTAFGSWVIGALTLMGPACSSDSTARRTASPVKTESPAEEAPLGPVIATGMASIYADRLAGRKTASGDPYDPEKLTCAHRKLPFGTAVEVRVLKSGRTVRCVINDRGPFHEKRVIDLSRAAARAIGVTSVAKVELRRVLAPEDRRGD